MKIVLMSVLSLLVSGAYAQDDLQFAQTNTPLTKVTIADGTNILADMNGLSIYTFDVDVDSNSTCYDACEKAWPPVLFSQEIVLGTSVGTTIRKDGSMQLTHNGKPIYYYVGDGAPGEINGDGLGGVWHIISVAN